VIRPVWLLASLAWGGLLVLRAVWPGDNGHLWELFAEARFGGFSWPLARDVLGVAALAALPAVTLGMLCRFAVRGAPGFLGVLRAPVVALGLGVAILAVAGGFGGHSGWHAPSAVELVLPAVACLVGVVLGGAFEGGLIRLLPSLFVRVVLLVGLGVAGLLGLAGAVLGEQAPDAPLARITSDQKRVLVARVRQHNPFKLVEGQRGGLSFGPEELTALLAWGALLVDDEARVAVGNRDDALGWLASVRLPVGIGGRRQFTVQGELALASGPAGLLVERCALAIGDLEVAAWLCRSGVYSLYRASRASNDFGALAAAVESLRIDGSGLTASYARPYLDDADRQRLQRALGPGREIRLAAGAQFELLRRRGAELASDPDRFGAVLAAAFGLARERSAHHNPVAQNQGAILALATILGHHDVATLAGIELPQDWAQIRAALRPVKLRGRDDWTRHFLVSAALTQVSTAVMSDAAGLLKEELDAAERSGFSFGDLLADRAGTRFGELAARDEAGARALQRAVADAYREDDVMPPADGLPEGLSDAEFQRRFGGVGGAGYQAVVADIESRIARLPKL
jgi:hypothetical protein